MRANGPQLFYNEAEALKYTHNSRIKRIQRQLSERAMELLMLPSDRKCLVLDVGCGSGLSGGEHRGPRRSPRPNDAPLPQMSSPRPATFGWAPTSRATC